MNKRVSTSEGSWLSHDDRRQELGQGATSDWVVIYEDLKTEDENGGIFCAIVPLSQLPDVLSRVTWDLRPGDAMPGVSHIPGQPESVTYDRFGRDDSVEPLLIVRSFPTLQKRQFELLEEFRLFHELYTEDQVRYVSINDDGDEQLVAEVGEASVRVRRRPLREFLAWKDACLVVFFDWTRFAPAAPDLPALEGARVRSENLVYDLVISSPKDRLFGDRRCSKLMGKYLIFPLPREKTTQWPMREDTRLHDSFVVGTDGDGVAIHHTCDPDALANYFGANAGAPNYLTPIAFSRDVMARYYDSPSKFVVNAGSVSRHGAWLLPVDADHQDRVVVYLGDLGRIPYAEQGHWRTHQLTDERAKVSDSAFQRDFMAQFAEVSQVEARFRTRLASLRDAWRGAFGWSLFREHSDDDAHVLSSFRVPLTNEQKEFDEQVQALAKILVDSLNDAEIASRVQGLPENAKSIQKLELFAKQNDLKSLVDACSILKDVQALRSEGAAHLKGSRYRKTIEAKLGPYKSFSEAFRTLLERALKFLDAATAACGLEGE